VIAGQYDVVIAGGVESMSRVPLGTATVGQSPFGAELRKHFPEDLVNQGVSAELIAQKWGFSRAQLDEFSAESHRRAAAATESGAFARELIPVRVSDAEG